MAITHFISFLVSVMLGLSTLGLRVLQEKGEKPTKLHPARGSSAEYASFVVVIVACLVGMSEYP